MVPYLYKLSKVQAAYLDLYKTDLDIHYLKDLKVWSIVYEGELRSHNLV